MRIIIDMDICDTNEYFFYNCKVRFARHDMVYDREALKDYHITHWFTNNKIASEIEAWAMKEQIFGDPDYWESIPPKKDAIEVIERLNKKHELYFASDSITIKNEAAMLGKRRWFKRFMPYIDLSQIIFMKHKAFLKADMIIEDQIDQVKNFEGQIILFNYCYNKDYTACYRVNDWLQVENIFNILDKVANK